MSNYKLVYSTEKPIKEDSQLQKNIATKKEQAVRIHLDRKGGGKIQTIVRGLIIRDMKATHSSFILII